MVESVQTEKAFVDAVDFLIWGESTQQAHHAVAEVGIEFVVARQGDDAVFTGQILHLKPWRTHLDAQGFDFGTAGDGTAIVVSE